MKSRSQKYDMNRPRSRHRHNYTNMKCVSVQRWLYVLSNTLATLEAQFMKKVSNTTAELKKKKRCL